MRSGDPGPQVKSELPGKALTGKRGLRFSGWRLADSVPRPTLSCALCPSLSLVPGGPTLARQNAEVLERPRPDFEAKAKGPHPFPSPLPPPKPG